MQINWKSCYEVICEKKIFLLINNIALVFSNEEVINLKQFSLFQNLAGCNSKYFF